MKNEINKCCHISSQIIRFFTIANAFSLPTDNLLAITTIFSSEASLIKSLLQKAENILLLHHSDLIVNDNFTSTKER